MTPRPHAAEEDEAAPLVPVTWAQLTFLVDGDPARLAPLRRRAVATATADVVRVVAVDLWTLIDAWVATHESDGRPGRDCAIPAWTPALAALAARRTTATEAVTETFLATTDYLVFGRAIPIQRLQASIRVPDPNDPVAGGPVPLADPRVTRHAADLQRLGAARDVADAAYRDAVRQVVAAAPALRSAEP